MPKGVQGFQKGHTLGLGKYPSEETKVKISAKLMGHPMSQEQKDRISKSNRGRKLSPEARQHISQGKMGHPVSQETRDAVSACHIGKKLSPEHRSKVIATLLHPKGPDHFNWRGGVTGPNKVLRDSPKYRVWRKAIFERDNYACQMCKQRGGKLHADHIKPFALYPELRFDVSNGRTLCISCHTKTDTWGQNTKTILEKQREQQTKIN